MFNDRAEQIELEGYTPDIDIDCCETCFSPSQDVDYQAVPEKCMDDGCNCHRVIPTHRPSISSHLLHTVVAFICGVGFAVAALAVPEDVDALWGMIR
jgi:hypothetical protein